MNIGTRIIIPEFETCFAYKKLTYLLAKQFSGSDASIMEQINFEIDLPPINGEKSPLTHLERLKYFHLIRKVFKITNFLQNIDKHLKIMNFLKAIKQLLKASVKFMLNS